MRSTSTYSQNRNDLLYFPVLKRPLHPFFIQHFCYFRPGIIWQLWKQAFCFFLWTCLPYSHTCSSACLLHISPDLNELKSPLKISPSIQGASGTVSVFVCQDMQTCLCPTYTKMYSKLLKRSERKNKSLFCLNTSSVSLLSPLLTPRSRRAGGVHRWV